MMLFTYSDEDFEDLFNINISEKDRSFIRILFFSSFIAMILFICYVINFISSKIYIT